MLDPQVFPLVCASENYFYNSKISKAIKKKKKKKRCSFHMKWLSSVERIAAFKVPHWVSLNIYVKLVRVLAKDRTNADPGLPWS